AAQEGEPAFKSLVEDENEILKTEMGAAETGDQKAFTVVTDDDISSLEIGDIYKSSGSFFKVTKINSKGADGGEFVVQRTAGSRDPSQNWSRVSGLGPITIRSRRTMFDWYLAGGAVMHFISFFLLLTIIILFNSLWIYRRGKQCPRRFIEEARRAIGQGDVDRLGELSGRERGMFPGVCAAMATNYRTSTVEDIKGRCEAEAQRQISLLRVPLKTLTFNAAISPLLGLFGTVLGIIMCFARVKEAGGAASAGNIQYLAGGIEVALLTTLFGLAVAMFALVVYFIFNQRLNLIIGYCELVADEFVHELALVKRSAPAPAAGAPQAECVEVKS
ncbi:MAG: MotA/TolQ/ExbB proton channel family protein, partial [Phycisphaerae bacterium]